MSNYKNLPGVNINVKDGQMLITEDNTSNSMLIIGEALKRKVNGKNVETPEGVIFAPTEDVLIDNFGGYFIDGRLNPIAAEWKVARENGVSNIYVLGLKKETDKERYIELQKVIFNELPDYEFSHIVVSGMYADTDIDGILPSDFGVDSLDEIEGIEVFHTLRATEEADNLVLDTEASKDLIITYGENEITVTITEKKENVAKTLKLIEKEAQKKLNISGMDIEVKIDLDESGNAVFKTSEEVSLKGDIATEVLKITPEPELEATIEGFGNVASMLGNYAEKQTLESGTVIVYIGTSPVATTDKKSIREKIVELVSRKNEYSKHVQIIAGPPVATSIPGSLRVQWLSGVTHYAVLVNSLAVQNAPTNQPLPGVNSLRYDLSLRQLDDLTGNKYVTFRSKNNRIVVVDGVTSAPDIYAGQDIVHSDFRRLTTLRSTSYMVNAIREVTDPFIGRPNEFPAYNAMNTAIRGVINTAVERGIIQDAAYSIELGDNLDVAKIDLTILPQFELRKIDVTIGLSLPGGFEAMSE